MCEAVRPLNDALYTFTWLKTVMYVKEDCKGLGKAYAIVEVLMYDFLCVSVG